MQYPLISEYIEAICSAEDNFDKLSNLRPVLDSDGNPMMSSGNFAVVFKMEDVSTHRLFAVKCFIKEQEGRGERYALIAEELQYVSSPYLLHVRYLERELFVSTAGCDEEEFPVLVMDWVEGQPLDAYLKQHLNNRYDLEMLAYRFCKMGAWLLSQPFAHGDLKPDNILVREDGSLVLVDYDGMYVSAMEGQTAAEMGSPDFRHPLRTEKDFNEHIDDFSIASIALSLKAISLDSQLYNQYATADRLLFSVADYRDIGKSTALKAIMPLASDSELSTLVSVFLLSLAKNSLSMVSFRIFLLNEPEKPVEEVLSTEITDEEDDKAIEDMYGARYTADGLKLVSLRTYLSFYTIKNGTKVIVNNAFNYNSFLKSITIPNSVNSIGNEAFEGCESLRSITIPDSVKRIGYYAFYNCKSLQSIIIPNSVKSIGDGTFYGCKSLKSITIPNSVTSIGNKAFCWCESLESITIPNSVKSFGDGVFNGCSNMRIITITSSKFYINNCILYTADGKIISCWSKDTHINLSNSVTSIGDCAFSEYESLESITIPNSVTSIGNYAFNHCSSLESINIPNSVTSIGVGVFDHCESLKSIIIPNSVIALEDRAFCCSSLESITIPNSVKRIGNESFAGCESLRSISIPDSVTSMGNEVFDCCLSLESITIPNSVTSMGKYAFRYCDSLKEIRIPKGSKNRFLNMIGQWYIDKLVEV